MCYEFDDYIDRMRIAEQLRKEREKAAEVKKQGTTTAPVAPAQTEKPRQEEETVPA